MSENTSTESTTVDTEERGGTVGGPEVVAAENALAEEPTTDEAATDEPGEATDEAGPAPAKDGDADSEDADTDDADSDDDDDDSDEDEDEDPLDVEGEVAADYLEELLDIADLDGDIDTYTENGRAHVSVVTESDTLVGANGEVLEALQELARLAVLTETGNRSRLMLDVAGFREKRRKELESLASDAVEETKASSEPVALSPMNPFERKIVHDFVAAAGLRSESEGEEPKRHVVVQPAS